jgi:UDP-N-acetylmuramoyl-L-alanyl-D-glutamate--2,6-diaminopimelate ligase
MEVSSHALVQHRVNGCRFQLGVFTNLTREHLDYHSSMANYCRSKQQLFAMAERGCIINLDDPYSRYMAEAAPDGTQIWYYSHKQWPSHPSHVYTRYFHCHLSGLTLEIVVPDGIIAASLPLIGVFNISNVLAAVTTLVALGFDAKRIEKALTSIQPVIGRMEPFVEQNKPLVVIDYAHTPDALQQSLQALRQHCPVGQLVCVFGCGGERDRGKRPQMGAIAQKHSDYIIITDDNPRFESPEQIAHDIVNGCHDKSKIDVEHDRSMALTTAFQAAEEHDVILIAGKGHENYQVRGGEHIPYSDREQTKRLLKCDSVS